VSRILIAGCGFLGEAAAFFLRETGASMIGLTASAESAQLLTQRGLPAHAADLSSLEALQNLATEIEQESPITAWIHCASSGRGGPDAYRQVYLQGCRNLLAAFPQAQACFVSSTSVYAQTDGSWVDETSPAEPTRETGQILRETEETTLAQGGRVARLAGIYGPGRSVLLRKFLAEEALIEGTGQRWINQIHRDDAASAIGQILLRGAGGEIYNVSDGHPWQQRAFYEEMARLLGRPIPPTGEPDLQRKRGWTSKRVAADKLRALGWQPKFPDYFAALPSLLPGSEENLPSTLFTPSR
jgi:nucleoside-diphosphate-sugar epimerase